MLIMQLGNGAEWYDEIMGNYMKTEGMLFLIFIFQES